MSEPIRRVLLLEPNEREARSILQALALSRRPRLEVRRGALDEVALATGIAADIDVVLLGLGGNVEDDLATLRAVRRRSGEVPILALSTVEDDLFGLQLVREGAQDWLPKSELTPSGLARAVRYAIERERACTMRPEPDGAPERTGGLDDALARGPTQIRPSRPPSAPPPASSARPASRPPARDSSRPRSQPPAARRSSRPPPSTDDILLRYLAPSGREGLRAPGAGSAAFDDRPTDSKTPRGSRPPPRPSRPPLPPGDGGIATSPPAAAAGMLDGKYRLLRRVAQGGLGEIYEARHEVIGHRVAVKMIRPEFSGEPELSVRFLQEARAAGAIGHPGCVKIFDFGVADDGRAYLVMEWLDGESVHQRLRRERRLPLRDAAAIALETLDVLAATHERGIIHRDLKPENIFLALAPHGRRRVKLLDFGIARLTFDVRSADTRLTRPGAVMGTPCYMAPEQATGSLDADRRIDLYAVGVLLFETTTGRVPFDGPNNSAILVQLLTAPWPSPRELEPSLPEAFEALVRRAMARNPADRFATADEFREALQPFSA